MSTIQLQIPDSLVDGFRKLAQKENVSVDHLAALAFAEKIAALETDDYLDQRAARGSKEKFLQALAKVPSVPPEEHDRF